MMVADPGEPSGQPAVDREGPTAIQRNDRGKPDGEQVILESFGTSG